MNLSLIYKDTRTEAKNIVSKELKIVFLKMKKFNFQNFSKMYVIDLEILNLVMAVWF